MSTEGTQKTRNFLVFCDLRDLRGDNLFSEKLLENNLICLCPAVVNKLRCKVLGMI